MVCRQGRGLCGMDVSGHTQDEVGMRGEITSPEALIVRHWQDLMQVRPLRSHGALNSKRTCACFNALPYLLRQTTHIPFCSPSDSLSHPHSMHSWYPLIMSSSNTSPARSTSQISLVTLASFHHPPPPPRPLKFGLGSSFSWTIPTASYLVFLCHSGLSRGCLTPQVLRACQRWINLHANDTSSYL